MRAFTCEAARRFLVAAILISAPAAWGQQYPGDQPGMGKAAQQLPSYLKHAGIEQHLNDPLPLNTVFTDEQGNTAALGHWVGGAPVILVMVYYKCRSLCPEVLHGLAAALRDSHLAAWQRLRRGHGQH